MGNFRVANVSCIAGEVVVPGPTGYLALETEACIYYSPCTFHAYDGTLQTNGLDIEYDVYFGQDSSKYYACGNDDNGHEVRLSQPYTQYGLEGHTLNSDFTSEQQLSVKQALYHEFIDAGIIIDINNDCYAGSGGASCHG